MFFLKTDRLTQRDHTLAQRVALGGALIQRLGILPIKFSSGSNYMIIRLVRLDFLNKSLSPDSLLNSSLTFAQRESTFPRSSPPLTLC